MWHDSFICVTWLIHMCDMTHSYVWHDSFIYVWHDSFICVTWLIHIHTSKPSLEQFHRMLRVRSHGTYAWVTAHMNESWHIWLSHINASCHIWMSRTSKPSLEQFHRKLRVCRHDMSHTHPSRTHGSQSWGLPLLRIPRTSCTCVCVTWLIDVQHDTLICVTWLIDMCDTTYVYLCHGSFWCVTWLSNMRQVLKKVSYALVTPSFVAWLIGVWHDSWIYVR